MTDKQIIIDGFNLEYIKKLLYNGQRSAITTNIFEAIIEELERKEQECETLASQLDFEVQKKECLEQECERLKETLKDIANRPCLNINTCNGNCLPHCKWNAHKLAQEALKGLE